MAAVEKKDCWVNEKLPSPVAIDYVPKGQWEQVGGLNNYIVGPKTSKKAVLLVYDAFGPSAQIIQGADRLSEHFQALVVMPDFFKGNTLDHDKFEKDRAGYMPVVQEFMKAHGDLEKTTRLSIELVSAFQSYAPSIQAWGIYGLCWGGKVAVVAATAENSPFKASGQTHPGRLAADDAKALTTPHLCQPSKDEPEDVVAEYEKILTEKKLGRVERFPTMFHGWMGARADLADQENLVEYQRGYLMAAEFFAENL